MWIIKITVFLSLLFLSTGCTSLMQAMNADPTRIHNIDANDDDVISTISLAANRRTIIVGLDNNNVGKFCAEPPPEVATNITSEVEAALKAKLADEGLSQGEAEATIKDKYVTTIVQLSERTVLLDVYRTGTYSLCQYHLNGALNEGELKEQFDKLTQQVLAKIPDK